MCKNKNIKCYELTKEQRKYIKPLLPQDELGKRGRPRKDKLVYALMRWSIMRGTAGGLSLLAVNVFRFSK